MIGTKTILITVLLLVLISPCMAVEGAELEFFVNLGEEDVSLESQIIIMSMPPIILEAGTRKRTALNPGTYSMITILETDTVSSAPVNTEITVTGTESQPITITLQKMPNLEQMLELLMGEGMDEMPKPEDFAMPAWPSFISESPPPSEAELETMLADQNDPNRYSAFVDLYERMGIEFLVESLDHEDGDIREWSLELLEPYSYREKGPSQVEDLALIPTIVSMLEDPHLPCRPLAANIIARTWTFPPAAIAKLIDGIEHEYHPIRSSFSQALGAAAQDDEEILNMLAKLVKTDAETSVRTAAVEALRRIGNGDAVVMEALTHAAQDESAKIRLASMEAIRRVPAPDPERVRLAAAALQDSENDVRRQAASILSDLGHTAAIVIADMSVALSDEDSTVRNRLLTAMTKMDADHLLPVIDPVTKILGQDPEDAIRAKAAEVLEIAGPKAANSVPSLIAALEDGSARVVFAAINALRASGTDNTHIVIPVLTDLMLLEMSRENRSSIWMARDALAAIGQPAIADMILLLDSDSIDARARAASVVGLIGEESEEAVPKLLSLFQDEDEDNTVRLEAQRAIVNITGRRPEL